MARCSLSRTGSAPFDMRSTSGAAAAYANDRPPRDAEVVAPACRRRVILAKANIGRICRRRPQHVRRHDLQSLRRAALGDRKR